MFCKEKAEIAPDRDNWRNVCDFPFEPPAALTKAGRDPADFLVTLQLLVLSHVSCAKPLHTFVRHALYFEDDQIEVM